MTYQILQLNNVPENHGYFFCGLEWLEKYNMKLSLDRYHVVYYADVDCEVVNIHNFLESLFTKFNINHPKDFRGHSLSVSDIVKIDDMYWYCDDFGWKRIYF